MKDTKNGNSILFGAAVIVFLLIRHILIEQEFFVKWLLSIAELDFWVLYFDPIFYAVFALIFVVIQRKMLAESVRDLIKNYKKYLPHVAVAVPVTLMLVVASAITISSFGIGDSPNEAAINEAVKAAPLIEGLTLILIGPFAEEMVFRGFIYEKVRCRIKNNRKPLICLWVFTAALLFALSHSDPEDLKSLKLMASYLIVFSEGLVMTVLYEKDRNIFSSLLLHCIINGIAFMK